MSKTIISGRVNNSFNIEKLIKKWWYLWQPKPFNEYYNCLCSWYTWNMITTPFFNIITYNYGISIQLFYLRRPQTINLSLDSKIQPQQALKSAIYKISPLDVFKSQTKNDPGTLISNVPRTSKGTSMIHNVS